MSRYSQGVLARKLVNKPCRPRRVVAGVDDAVRPPSAAPRRPMSPRSSTTILKPPAVPRPSTGGAPKTLTRPSLISSCSVVCKPRGDRVAGEPGVGAVVEVVEHHVHRAEVGRVGVQQDRLAGDRHGVRDARASRWRSRSIVLHHLLGALERRRVGQLHVDQQVALVLRRDEPGGRLREAPVGQPQQAAVEQQHEHADPQQAADHPRVDARGRSRSRRLNEAERPAEHAIEQRPLTSQPAAAAERGQPIGQASRLGRASRQRPARSCQLRSHGRQELASPASRRPPRNAEPRQRLDDALVAAAAAAAPPGPG